MARETSKAHARRAKDPLFQEVFRGKAIDLGAGEDPLRDSPDFPHLKVAHVVDRGGDHPNLLRVDVEEIGEAAPTAHLVGGYDLVYSSQCLEHCNNPLRALCNWWRLVKVGGALVITVPDFMIYENGFWPHLFNSRHVTAWRVNAKAEDPPSSPGSIPLRELLVSLPGAQLQKCEIEDTGYDYELLARVQTGKVPATDQTMPPYNAEAFIEAVVRKIK